MVEWETIVEDLYARHRKESKKKGQDPKPFDEFLKQFKGDKGEPGEQGLTGPQGEPGSNGTDGIDGEDGEDGAKGNKGDKGDRGLRGFRGLKGLVGPQGLPGIDGENGWTPELAVVPDNERRVLKVVDWFGGTGLKPQSELFLSETGYVTDIRSGTDIRGEKGERGQAGSIGLKGALTIIGGGAGDEVDYATNLDIEGDITYVGKADPGSSTSSAVWQIKKLTTAADGDIVMQWADGNASFDNIWDNRASLSYS